MFVLLAIYILWCFISTRRLCVGRFEDHLSTGKYKEKLAINNVKKIIVVFFSLAVCYWQLLFHKINKFIPLQVTKLTSDFKTCVSL